MCYDCSIVKLWQLTGYWGLGQSVDSCTACRFLCILFPGTFLKTPLVRMTKTSAYSKVLCTWRVLLVAHWRLASISGRIKAHADNCVNWSSFKQSKHSQTCFSVPFISRCFGDCCYRSILLQSPCASMHFFIFYRAYEHYITLRANVKLFLKIFISSFSRFISHN